MSVLDPLWNALKGLWAPIAGIWSTEPLRFLAIAAVVLNTLHDQLTNGVSWQTAIVAALIVVLTELGRSQVSPAG